MPITLPQPQGFACTMHADTITCSSFFYVKAAPIHSTVDKKGLPYLE